MHDRGAGLGLSWVVKVWRNGRIRALACNLRCQCLLTDWVARPLESQPANCPIVASDC